MQDTEQILAAVADLAGKIQLASEPTVFGLPIELAAVIVTGIVAVISTVVGAVGNACLSTWQTRMKDSDNRLRSAYDDIVNRLADTHEIYITNRIWNVAAPAQIPNDVDLINRDAFERIILGAARAKNHNAHLVHPSVVTAVEAIIRYNYQPNVIRTLDEATGAEQSSPYVPVRKGDFEQLVKNVQAQIAIHYPRAGRRIEPQSS